MSTLASPSLTLVDTPLSPDLSDKKPHTTPSHAHQSPSKSTTAQVDRRDRPPTSSFIYCHLNRQDGPYIATAVLSSIFCAGLTPLFTWTIGLTFAAFTDYAVSSAAAEDAAKLLKSVGRAAIYYIVLAIAAFVFEFTKFYTWSILAERNLVRIRRSFFRSLESLDMAWYDCGMQSQSQDDSARAQTDASRPPSIPASDGPAENTLHAKSNDVEESTGPAALSQNFSRQTEDIRLGTGSVVGSILQRILTFIACLILAFVTSWCLSLVILANVPILFAAQMISARKTGPLLRQEHMAASSASKVLHRLFSSFSTVKALQGESTEISAYRAALEQAHTRYLQLVTVWSSALAFNTTVASLLFVECFIYGSYLLRQKLATPKNIMTAFYAALMAADALKQCFPLFMKTDKAFQAWQQILCILNLRPSARGSQNISSGAQVFTDNKVSKPLTSSIAFDEDPVDPLADICFDDITFAYPARPSHVVLSALQLTISGGHTSFIIGKSGSGKSTLAQLLSQLYIPLKGTIRIGSRDISSFGPEWLISNVAIVTQHATIFPMSMHDNVALGMGDVSRYEVVAACALAQIDCFIQSLPQGYDTLLGSDGVKLSGGQAQRLAVARAFLHNPPIVLVDEITSALDIPAKEELIKQLRRTREHKTTIIITHDLSYIKPDDIVHLMAHGSLLHSGTMAEVQRAFPIAEQKLSNQPVMKSQQMDSLPRNKPPSDSLDKRPKSTVVHLLNLMRLASNNSSVRPQKSQDPLEAPRIQLSISEIATRVLKDASPRAYLILAFAAFALKAACAPLFSYYLSKLIVAVTKYDLDMRQIAIKASVPLSIAFADGFATLFSFSLSEMVSSLWMKDLRVRLINQAAHQDMQWTLHPDHNISRILDVFDKGAAQGRQIITGFLGQIFFVVMLVSIGLIWALVQGWQLTLAGLSLLPIIAIVSFFQWRFISATEADHRVKQEKIIRQLLEYTSGIRGIRSLHVDEIFFNRFCDDALRAYKASQGHAAAQALSQATLEAFVYAIQAFMFYLGAVFIAKNIYSYGQMLAVFTLIVFTLVTASGTLSLLPSVERIHGSILDLLNIEWRLQHISSEQKGTVKASSHDIDITLENVTFAYPNSPEEKILKDFSLKIRANKITGIVGPSGSGKSSVAALLQKLYEPSSGCVRLSSGARLSDIDVISWRTSLRVVSQTMPLFNMSVRQNLTYGCRIPPAESAVIRACGKAQAFDFISSLPQGMDTDIGAHADLFSGGQRQRLAVARSMLNNRYGLRILDECTSALDATTSQILLQELFDEEKKTTVLITHNVDVMRYCDQIAYMQDGQVKEFGSFEDLCRSEGPFSAMIRKEGAFIRGEQE